MAAAADLDSPVPKCRHLCCGCQETPGTTRITGLGWVCDSCVEVLDIVYEVEIERVVEAHEKLLKFVEDLEAGRL